MWAACYRGANGLMYLNGALIDQKQDLFIRMQQKLHASHWHRKIAHHFLTAPQDYELLASGLPDLQGWDLA